MTPRVRANLLKLARALQELRDLIDKPIRITSGYRCTAHNAAVGGVSDSQHTQGLAADVTVQGMTPDQIAAAAARVAAFRQGGIGVYPEQGFTHLDVRGHMARWRG